MHLEFKGAREKSMAALVTVLVLLIAASAAVCARAADNGKLAAWAIGHNLSLAALLYAQGNAPQLVDQTLGKAKSAAAAIDVEIKPFPAPGKTKGETTAQMIQYLIKGDGWSTGQALATKYGPGFGVLFELAVKSNLAIILYQPGDDSGIAGVVKARSEAIHLPPELWMPLVTAMNDKRAAEDVKQAVFKMHDAVAAALANQPEASNLTVGQLLEQGGKRLGGAEIK